MIYRITEHTSGLRQHEASNINRLFSIKHFHAPLSLNYTTAGGRDTDITTNTHICLTKDAAHCLMWLYMKCTYFCQIIMQIEHNQRETQISMVHTKIFYSPLWKHDDMRQIFPYTEISTFSDNKNEPDKT